MGSAEPIKKVGIVLRKTDVKEADAMVGCIGREGRFSFYARGVRKAKSKNAFALSELTLSEFTLFPGSSGALSLKEAAGIKTYLKPDDFDAIAVENFICELSSRLFSEEEGEGAGFYPFLFQSLEAIVNGFDPLTIGFLCLCQGLKEAGYGLEVDNCVRCKGKKNIIGMSLSDGGYVCSSCFGGGQDEVEDPYVLKMYRYGFRLKEEDITRVAFERSPLMVAYSKLERYFRNAFGYGLKSLGFLIENC